jgi:hypothetical protein
MVFLLVVRGFVPRDAEGVLLLLRFVRFLWREGVLIFLFFDGVARVEAEEAAADLHVILGLPCLFWVYCAAASVDWSGGLTGAAACCAEKRSNNAVERASPRQKLPVSAGESKV